jgi:hypothetical protein
LFAIFLVDCCLVIGERLRAMGFNSGMHEQRAASNHLQPGENPQLILQHNTKWIPTWREPTTHVIAQHQVDTDLDVWHACNTACRTCLISDRRLVQITERASLAEPGCCEANSSAANRLACDWLVICGIIAEFIG